MARKPISSMTKEEKDSYTKLFLKPCKNRKELQAWIKYFLDLHLPDVKVSRYADTTPFDVIWEVYRICVLKQNPEKVQELLYVASRGAGKTLGMAIAEMLVVLHDQRDVCHVGAIQNQADRCYNYIKNFLYSRYVKEIVTPSDIPEELRILEKANMSKSLFNIGEEKITLEVLPCTLKSCNGPHVPLVVVDELETISGEGLLAFKEISGMLDSKKGKKALRVGISTRKSRYGLMNKQIENADKEGRVVRKWTAFEFTERCPDDRSGTRETDLYTIQDKLEAITEEDFKKRAPQRQKDYTCYKMWDKCVDCPLAAICLGDAKKQTSKSPMLKTLDELCQKVRAEGADWALAQLMNLKPSVEGIIYREFEERVHVKTWNEMWKTLVGQDFPGECTHDIFVKKCFSSDTEVLTQNGFKFFNELTPYDKIASLDDSGKLIYELPTDYIAKPYNGKAVNIHNSIGGHGKQLDLLVTEDHMQTYVSSSFRKNGKFKIQKKKASELPGGDFYIPAAPLITEDKPGFPSPISYMTDDQFYAYLGLWLSEGSMASVKAHSLYRQNTVEVSQIKPLNVPKVDELMKSIKWPGKMRFDRDKRKEQGGVWQVCDKELYDYLRQYKYAVNKGIPRVILEQANNKQLSILLEWLMFGDGASYENNDEQQPFYGSGSMRLINDVQELAFRLGYRTNLTTRYSEYDKQYTKTGMAYLDKYKVQIHSKGDTATKKMWYIGNGTSKSEFSDKRGKNIDTVDYVGMVYCVTMPSGRLFVRRNGVIALSGNCNDMKLQCFAGVDWGWSAPNTVVYFFVDSIDNVYVVRCDGMTYISQPGWIHHIKNKYHNMYRCQMYFPDPADQGAVEEMKKAGLPVANIIDKSINPGIQVIKKMLRTPGSLNAKLFLAKETTIPLVQEFMMYHFKTNAAGEVTDDPDTEFDHWLDALRYALMMLFGKAQIVMGGGGLVYDTGLPVDKSGSYTRTPSPAEFAANNGMNFNNEVDNSKVGKIVHQKEGTEPDDDDENGGVGGDSGFLWSL